ncbi:DnaT-like ssDNA-binding protein [Limnobaculum xujianqingii]|uniref:DnaT-like ssDNA-binding protein n=1 Tax=Limnobaculum xujianqingii TaxID=2738837 RepID=UPI00112A5A26|nr:DnaT-like ssDNA-binding protein [Limnobaculum xujianqingii]
MLITDPTLPGFNSYASVDDLRQFAITRGYHVPESDDECEPLLFQAMDYLTGQNWRGYRSSPEQALPWPRSGVIVDGVEVAADRIPSQLIQAQCRLAIEAQETDLTPSFSGGGEVVAESISGAVSVQYAEGSSASPPYFPWLTGLLRGLLGSGAGVNFDVMRG